MAQPLIFVPAAKGNGNIAYVIGLASRWTLAFVRIHFARTGSGTDTAALTFDIDNDLGSEWDTRIWTHTTPEGSTPGVGSDVNLCPGDTELARWTFEPWQKLVINWANPDSPEITWGLEAAVRLAE